MKLTVDVFHLIRFELLRSQNKLNFIYYLELKIEK